MLKKSTLGVTILLFIALFALSCSDVTLDTPTIDNTSIIGTWTGTFVLDTAGNIANLTAEINVDQSFSFSSDTIIDPINGFWALSGSNMIISGIPNEDDKTLPTVLSGDILVVQIEGIPLTLYRQ